MAADRLAEGRRARPKAAKLAACPELRAWVQDRLAERWSPAQISASLRTQFPGRPELQVCHETIYQALFVQAAAHCARSSPPACAPAGRAPPRRAAANGGRIPEMVMISERPAEVPTGPYPVTGKAT